MSDRRWTPSSETRPWGYWEDVLVADAYRVKRVIVQPGHRLSLQTHQHRSEHWVVVAGRGEARIDGQSFPLDVGDHVAVAVGAMHRLINSGTEPLIIIETQIGICDETDIIRFEDDYHRV